MSKKTVTLKKTAAALLGASLMLPGVSAAGSAGSASPAAAPAAASGLTAGLVPVREAAAKLGLTVDYRAKEQSVVLTKGNLAVELLPASAKAIINGKAVDYSATGPAVFRQGKTLVSEAWLKQVFSSAEVIKVDESTPAGHFLNLLVNGSGKEAYSLLSSNFQEAITSEQLGMLWGNYEGLYGKAESITLKTDTTNNVHREVVYSVKTAAVPLSVSVRFNPAGEVDDLYLTAETPDVYQKPAYDQPSLYTEQEVTIGSGEFALPGTLTKPAGKGPFPVVVLVHGSGPQDRDSSLYGAKPFRDIAVGLAAKGIATLRYEKVTYEHTFKVAADPKFTLKQETVDDALRAVQLLSSIPDIDAGKIVVAGHSQGGFAMPLITAADHNKQIDGTILLSAPSSSFTDVAVLQQEELVNRIKQLGGDTAPYEQQAAVWKQIAAMVNDPMYSADKLPQNFPVSPAYWWYEQRNYVPVELAKQQQGPLLILQGENDWQVPLSQFEGWKKGLTARTDVEYHSYPGVNHLLAKVDTLSTGEDYAAPSNVSETIINDMASWVLQLKSGK